MLLIVVTLFAAGCQSPYRSDQGALFGGLLGAGTGAIVGDALGNAGAGAAIGAGVGALSGAAVGDELDRIEAQNRSLIEQRLGRQVDATAVTMGDVVSMTAAGVDENLIVNHVRAHGVAAPLTTQDVIALHQQGVSTRVIETMQNPLTTFWCSMSIASMIIALSVAFLPVVYRNCWIGWMACPCR